MTLLCFGLGGSRLAAVFVGDPTWLGGTGNWSDTTKWDSGAAPTSGQIARIDAGLAVASAVTLNASATVAGLTISSGDSLTIGNYQSLTLAKTGAGDGTIAVDGTLSLSSGGNDTSLILSGGDVVLSGAGSLVLATNAPNRVYGATASDRLINRSTILGIGQLGLNQLGLVNEGLIHANQSGATLTIDPSAAGLANTGTLRASNGGILRLQGAAITNTGGKLEALAASFVDLDNTTLTGGTLETFGSGAAIRNLSTATLTDITLNSSSTLLKIQNYTTLNVGGTLTNLGTISLQSGGNDTNLIAAATGLTLTGGGTIELATNAPNRLYGPTATTTLVNLNNVIRGAGQLGVNSLQIDNRGIIDASLAGATLTIDPSGTGVANAGTLRASNGGILRLQGGTFTNTGAGNITALAASFVDLDSVTIVGGTLETGGSGAKFRNLNSSTLTDVTLNTAATQIDLPNYTSLVAGGTLANRGVITLLSGGNDTNLIAAASGLTLTGGGTIDLATNAPNRLYGQTATTTLVNLDNLIRGAGQIGVNTLQLDNRSVIQASLAGATLTIDPSGSGAVNTGTLRATAGGILRLQGGLFTNAVTGGATTTNGTIQAQTGSTVQLSGATVTGGLVDVGPASAILTFDNSSFDGGTLTTTSGSILRTVGGSSTLGGGVTIASGAQLNLDNYTSLTLLATGTFTNHGTISLNSGGNDTNLIVSGGDVTLTGTGYLVLATNAPNRVYGATATDRLVNQLTIQGTGSIGLNQMGLVNQGTIEANQSGLTLTIDPSSAGLANTGTLRAANGGILRLQGATIANTGGKLEALAGSFVDLDSVTLASGTFETVGPTARFRNLSTSTLTDVTFATAATRLDLLNYTTLYLGGILVNPGAITLLSGGNDTNLIATSSGLTLDGGGIIDLATNAPNRLYGQTATTTLVNVNNLIRGAGQLGVNSLQIDNRGMIDANRTGATLTIDPSGTGVANTGTLRASNGGILRLQGGTFTNTGAGRIEALAGSFVDLDSATIVGGILETFGSGATFRNLSASTLSNVILGSSVTQLELQNYTTVYASGTLTNLGTIALRSGGNNTSLVAATGGLTLDGGGTIDFTTNAPNLITGQSAETPFINLNNVIRGAGQVGVNTLQIDNRGVIQASLPGATLTIDPSAAGLANTGALRATNGGILRLQGGTFTNTGAGKVEVDTGGRVEFSSATVIGGTLNGGLYRNLDSTRLQGLKLGPGLVLEVPNYTSVTLAGAIENAGTISLLSGGNNTDLVIDAGGVSLTGGGTIALTTNAANRIVGATAGAALVNQNNLIIGAGQLGANTLTLTNNGTIEANQSNALTVDLTTAFTNQGVLRATGTGGLVFNDAPLTNRGNIVVAPGSKLKVSGNLVQDAPLAGIDSAGTIETTLLDNRAGTTRAAGTITGAVQNAADFGSNATLSITGTLTLQAVSSRLLIGIGGSTGGTYGHITAASMFLDGGLAVQFIDGFQNSIQQSDNFTILTATNALSGTFAGLANGARVPTSDGFGSFIVNYSGLNVSLTDFQPVPEPSTWMLLLTGVGGLLLAGRRRRRTR